MLLKSAVINTYKVIRKVIWENLIWNYKIYTMKFIRMNSETSFLEYPNFFETGSHVVQADLELEILLSQPPRCWKYRLAHSIRVPKTLKMETKFLREMIWIKMWKCNLYWFKNIWAANACAYLSLQHWGWGKRMASSRPAWTTWQEPVSKNQNQNPPTIDFPPI